MCCSIFLAKAVPKIFMLFTKAGGIVGPIVLRQNDGKRRQMAEMGEDARPKRECFWMEMEKLQGVCTSGRHPRSPRERWTSVLHQGPTDPNKRRKEG